MKSRILFIGFLSLYLFFFKRVANGQADSSFSRKHFFFQFDYQPGALLKSDSLVEKRLIHNRLAVYELRFGRQFTSDDGNDQDQLLKFSSIGFGASFFDFRGVNIVVNNKKVRTGQPLALFSFVKNPISRSDSWVFGYKIALGISFNFITYNSQNNPYSSVIGSSRNVYISPGFFYEYIGARRWQYGVGVDFKHFSNGAYRLPNDGVDFITLNAYALYNLNKSPRKYVRHPVPPYPGKHEITLMYGTGPKMLDEDQTDHINRQWWDKTLSGCYLYQVNQVSKIGGGIDVDQIPYGNYIIQRKDQMAGNVFSGRRLINDYESGLFVAFEPTYRNFSIVMNIGTYWFRVAKEHDSREVYERVGAKYAMGKSKRFFAGVALKTHSLSADYVVMNVGYSVWTRPAKNRPGK